MRILLLITLLISTFVYSQECSVDACQNSTQTSCFLKDKQVFSVQVKSKLDYAGTNKMCNKMYGKNSNSFQLNPNGSVSCLLPDGRPLIAEYSPVVFADNKNVLFCTMKEPEPPKQCSKLSDKSNSCIDNLISKSIDSAVDKFGVDGYQCGHQFVGNTYRLSCGPVLPGGNMSYNNVGGTCQIDYEDQECENQEEPEPPEEPKKPDVPCFSNVDNCDIPPNQPPVTDPIPDPNTGTGGEGGQGGTGGEGGQGGTGGEGGHGNGLTKQDVTDAINDADILGCKSGNCDSHDFGNEAGDAGFEDVPDSFWDQKYDDYALSKLYDEKIEQDHKFIRDIENIDTDLGVGAGKCPVFEFDMFGKLEIPCYMFDMMRYFNIFMASLYAFFIVFRK